MKANNGQTFSSDQWIDLTNPTEAELIELAEKYNLHPNAVQDCLKPDHLPKYEEIDDSLFIVCRTYDTIETSLNDSIQEVSRKISIFIVGQTIITIHRSEQPFLQDLRTHYVDRLKCHNVYQLLFQILVRVINSYEAPGLKLNDEIDFYESKIFLKKKLPNMLKNLYKIKRKVSVIKRILMLSQDIINKLEFEHRKEPLLREMHDCLLQQETIYDQLNDDINNLLQLYLSISAQRTNEVIRVLTIFSVFFLPLTFIVGVYGMNFQFMPELSWPNGYYYSIALMIVITIVIYIWFRRKEWL